MSHILEIRINVTDQQKNELDEMILKGDKFAFVRRVSAYMLAKEAKCCFTEIKKDRV